MQKGNSKKYNYKNHLSDSQNFLTNRTLIKKIVNRSTICKNDIVLEIGTGKGHLTEILCQKSGTVYSIEIDQRLFESSRAKLNHFSNLTLIHEDFLHYSLPAKVSYKVFANIPYFITTPIIEKLTNAPNPPADIWLIMEKGAAMRFAGFPRETEKSLLLKVKWNMKILHHFRKKDFHPMPSVDSVLLHFSQKETPDLDNARFPAFKKFVAHSMKYGICGKQGLLTKRQVSVALKRAGLPPARENGVTLYIQWLCLFRCYQSISR